jgi:hypothetical protein
MSKKQKKKIQPKTKIIFVFFNTDLDAIGDFAIKIINIIEYLKNIF